MDAMTKERPIIFSGDMVNAILAGNKTQTRRVIKPQPWLIDPAEKEYHKWECYDGKNYYLIECPYGQPGDRPWVRETFGYITLAENEVFTARRPDGCPVRIYYKSEANREGWVDMVPWTPSVFMPRWASRIMLEIVSIRVERLQDISEADAFAEGISGGDWLGDPVGEFKKLWNSINEKRGFGWETNCWVWVIGFKKLETAPRTDVLNY